MKKINLFFLAILFKATPVFAAIDQPENPGNRLPTDLKAVITTISNTLLMVLGVIAVLFIIIGGFQYVTSAGNPDNVGKAKNTILYGIIGLVFAIISYAIVKFVIDNIG